METTRGPSPTQQQVARNVKVLRKSRGLTLTDLAERTQDVGWPIGVTTLHKIEKGTRRVGSDDLVSLALALDATPNRLLLPDHAKRVMFPLTPTVSARAFDAWRWACGERPLPAEQRRIRPADFELENRPHAPSPDPQLEELLAHAPELRELVTHVNGLVEAGLNPVAIARVMELIGGPLGVQQSQKIPGASEPGSQLMARQAT